MSWAEGRPSQSVPRARAGSETLSYPGAWGRRANTKNSSEGAYPVDAEDLFQQVSEQRVLQARADSRGAETVGIRDSAMRKQDPGKRGVGKWALESGTPYSKYPVTN